MATYEGWRESGDIAAWPPLHLSEEDQGARRCADCGKRANHVILSGPVFLCMVCVNVRRGELARARKQSQEDAQQ